MTDVTVETTLLARFEAARRALIALATSTGRERHDALHAVADAIDARATDIVDANGLDLANGRENGLAASLLDRLSLTPERVASLSGAVREIAALPDPLGQTIRGSRLANGLKIDQVRVPFGVVGAIYEARPNVTVDIACLALASGNAAILRGGSAAERSNAVLVDVMRSAIAGTGLPADAVQTIDDFGREGASALMTARGFIDVLVPRGSASLIETVVSTSTVPVIETGSGVVHIVLDASAREDWSVAIVRNAKVQRPSVCNAVETLLVHARAAERLLPPVLDRLAADGVTVHGDEATRVIWPAARPASSDEWSTEHLSLDIGVRVVADLDEAVSHIRRYSTGHTESIITEDVASAERFLAEVDSAVVMVNASTRFTDGGEFGFGAEVGISTQKLHARGPMGVAELTSTKWIVRGNGQSRS
jgi:glutamate-5-semialdehyde dehydrogenase